MKNVLDILSERELKLREQVISLQGYLEEMYVRAKELGLFAEYRQIHQEYLNAFLAGSDEQKSEALKRIIFLNWYMLTEPGWLSGIDELDEATVLRSFVFLNEYIRQGRLADEFNWMLSYYSCFDWAILHFSEGKFYSVTQFVESVDPLIEYAPINKLPVSAMENRGQMGVYWKSILFK